MRFQSSDIESEYTSNNFMDLEVIIELICKTQMLCDPRDCLSKVSKILADVNKVPYLCKNLIETLCVPAVIYIS